jgi:dTDP-4-dehydrorhamnose 3,5-epimerase
VIFDRTPLDGVVLVGLEPHRDERGFFARTVCARDFEDEGLPAHFVQSSIAWNEKRHTLRGMHWLAPPHGEAKLVRCTRGAIFDVVVDIRPESPTYLAHFACELSDDNRQSLFVPAGLAHGYLTLTDQTEVLYQIDNFYASESDRGARWDDAAFAIDWPAQPLVMSSRDKTFPPYTAELEHASSLPWN